MNLSNKVKSRIKVGLQGVFFIFLGAIIAGDHYGESLFAAILFFLVCVGLPPLVTFMSDNNEVNTYILS